MRKTCTLLLAILLMAALVFTGCAGGQTPDPDPGPAPEENPAEEDGAADFKPVALNMALSYGNTHPAYKIMEQWAEKVADYTDGKVTVTLYPSESLVKAADMFESVTSGVVDIVETATTYAVSSFPLCSVFYLGGIPLNNSEAATAAVDDFYNNPEIKETQQVKMLIAYGMTPSVIISTTPVRTLEDVKGMQLRSVGMGVDVLAALGATPVGITMAETYEALMKGTVDGVVSQLETIESQKFADYAKYVTIAPVMGIGCHYLGMNLELWNSFPADIQAAIEQANAETLEVLSHAWDEMDAHAMEFGKENGVEFIVLDDAELQRWGDTQIGVNEKWIADREAEGLNAQYAYDYLVEIAAKYNDMYAE